MTAKRSIRESTGRWIFSSVEAIGTKKIIARNPARTHGRGRLVWGKASRGGDAVSVATAPGELIGGATGARAATVLLRA